MSDKMPAIDTPENWGAASRGYAEDVAPVLMRAFTEPLVEQLAVDQSAEVLEVGAGSGILTEALFPRVKSVMATDFAPKMIDVLRERLQAAGAANVQCKVMDGQALAFPDSSFDAAASSFALMFFPDRVKGFAELCRVVRPGGRVAVAGWAGPDRFESFGLFLAAMQSAFPDMPAPPSPPPVFSLSDLDVFKSEMEAAGFRDVKVEFVARELALPDFDGLWRMMTAGAPPVQALLDRVGITGKERLRESLHALVEERFPNGAIRLTNAATLGAGVAT